MEKLERLTQDDSGIMHGADGTKLHPRMTVPTGKICAVVVQNSRDISTVVDEMAARDSLFIPKGATAYVASEFSGDTQHVRTSDSEGTERMYSVYALQFYYVSPFDY